MHLRVGRWTLALSILSSGPLASGAAAQTDGPAPFLGLSIGGGEAPVTLIDGCVSEDRFRTSGSSMLAELRVGLPVGPVVLESRTTTVGTMPGGAEGCFSTGEPLHEDGTHTDRLRGVEGRGFTATDFRVRASGFSGLPLHASLGAGRVWREDVVFLLAGAGLRTPGQWRGAVDLEWTTYRVPFDVVTREWANGAAVEEIERNREHEWQGGWSVRVGVEYQLR